MISEDEIRERIVQFENWKIKIIRWLSGNLNEHYRRIPMSEITKLYENAGIESTGFNPYRLEDEYPPFTAEKQIELIKYIASKGLVQINYWTDNCYSVSRFGCTGDNNTEFSEALANVIAKDWKNLCKEQQEEIRKILKG